MNHETWTAVDSYIAHHLMPADAILKEALSRSDAAGLPSIHVSETQGRFLHLLAKVQGARRILELGTLAGYSTIWLARALAPGGRLVTLEFDPTHADVASENIKAAGLDGVVQIIVGAALDNLPKLETGEPFDLVFIDADKPNNPGYLNWALKLTRPGSLIVVDNVVRNGEIVNEHSFDAAIRGTREMFDLLANEPRLTATALQTVGSKGYDGFMLARVNES